MAVAEESPIVEAGLWAELQASGSAAAREALFVIHVPYAKALAAKLYSGRLQNDVEFPDFFQLAAIGLLEAIDRFDPSRGVAFRSYATRRIQGNVLSGVESLTEIQQQISARGQITSDRISSLQGATGKQRATETKAALALLADIAVGLAIGFMLEETGMYREADGESTQAGVYETVSWRETKLRMTGFVAELPERERKIINYHYFLGLQFEQIAKLVGVTKGRISQIHGRALRQLRARFGSQGEFVLSE